MKSSANNSGFAGVCMWNVVPCSFEAPYTLTYTYRYIYMHLEGLVTL